MASEIRREWIAVLKHWLTAAVGLTLATGAGSAFLAPPSDANSLQRVAFAALGIAAGIALVMLVALAIALLRVPAAEYSERHRLRKLGQELMDVAYEMIFLAAPFPRAGDGTVAMARDEDWTSVVAGYNTTLAARVFHSTRELEKREVITRERREALNEDPVDLGAYFARTIDLVGIGNMLGAEHPADDVTVEMISGTNGSDQTA